MKIPFGSRAPDEKESKQLKKLGFDLDKVTYQGRYYFLETPDDPRIQVNEKHPAFDRREITVSFNEVEVISINQKTAMYDAWVHCHLNAKNIEEALLKKDVIPEKKPELTEYQEKLANRLLQLEDIIFGDGAQRGYGSFIGAQFPYLIKLREENPEEHDKFIASKESYKKLYQMFPNWTDRNNLQRKYEAMDVGVFAAMSASSYDGEPPQCRLM